MPPPTTPAPKIPRKVENESFLQIIQYMKWCVGTDEGVSAVLNCIASEFQQAKANPDAIPFGIPIEAATLQENQATTSASSPTNEPEAEEEAAEGAEGKDREAEEENADEREEAEEMETLESKEDEPEEKSVKKKKSEERCSAEKGEAVMDLEGDVSEGEKTTPDARAVRISLRTARKHVTEETDDLIEEATYLVKRGTRAEKRKRKGKQISITNKTRKP